MCRERNGVNRTNRSQKCHVPHETLYRLPAVWTVVVRFSQSPMEYVEQFPIAWSLTISVRPTKPTRKFATHKLTGYNNSHEYTEIIHYY